MRQTWPEFVARQIERASNFEGPMRIELLEGWLRNLAVEMEKDYQDDIAAIRGRAA